MLYALSLLDKGEHIMSKQYTELQLKRGIGHWYEFINLKLLYKETEKTIIVTKKYW